MEDVVEAENIFDDADGRKRRRAPPAKFIEDNALDVVNLDI